MGVTGPLRVGAVDRWFTDRIGGVSAGRYGSANLSADVGDDPAAVAENRRRVAVACGLSELTLMRARHGAEVAVVTDPKDLPDVDAMVTAVPGIALTAMAADCVPVLLADAEAGVVGAVHSGRRGVVVDVTGAAVAAMVGLGARPDRITALLGPAICGDCYEVGAEIHDATVAAAPAAAAVSRAGRPALDLRAAIAARLTALGIAAESVGGCTAEDPALYSYRRDGVTGRQAGIVVLR